MIGVTPLSPREKFTSQPYALYAGNGVPAGTIIAYAGNKDKPADYVPDGYLLCDGKPYSATAYPALFEAIGVTYNPNQTSFGDTFYVPNLQGMFLRGVGGNSLALGIPQGDAIRNISGEFNAWRSGSVVGPFYEISRAGTAGGSGQDGPRQTGFDASRVVPTANENRPVNYAVKYCIKY